MISWFLGVLGVKENCKKSFIREWIIYKFHNADINQFIFLLRNWVDPCEYMNSYQTFDEIWLSCKENGFYSHLNIKGIIYVDCRHAKNMYKESNVNNLGNCHDFHVQSFTLFVADIFENVRNKCIEMYELDLAHLV